MAGQPWTKEEDKRLEKLIDDGYSDEDIARLLGRTTTAIEYHLRFMNGQTKLNKDKAKPRLCLRCHNTFKSLGPGNRICPSCSNSGRCTYDPTLRSNYYKIT